MMKLNSAATWLAGKHQLFFALLIRGIATVGGFAVTLLIGRIWGPETNGLYALAMQSGMLLASIALMGTDMGIVRHFSANMGTGLRLGMDLFARTVGLTLLFILLIAGIFLAVDNYLYSITGSLSIPAALVFPILLIFVGRALARTFGAMLRAQQSYKAGQSVEVALLPLMVAVAILTAMVANPDQLIWAAAIAASLTALIGFMLCLPHFSKPPQDSKKGGDKQGLDIGMSMLMRTSIPLWGLSLSLTFLDWYVLAVSSWLFGNYETGLLRVTLQSAALMQIVASAFFGVYAPQISASFHQNDLQKTGQLTRSATIFSSAITFPIFILLFVFAEQLLALLGPEFADAATELRILATGQLFLTFTGPSGLTLAMAGLGKYSLRVNIIAIAIFCVIAPLAGQTFGIAGIAAAFAILMVMRNLLCWLIVRRMLGLNVITGHIGSPGPNATNNDIEKDTD